MDTQRVITALMMHDAKNAGDNETYETILGEMDDRLALLANVELSGILLRIAAKARGISVDELVGVLMATAFNLSKEQNN